MARDRLYGDCISIERKAQWHCNLMIPDNLPRIELGLSDCDVVSRVQAQNDNIHTHDFNWYISDHFGALSCQHPPMI